MRACTFLRLGPAVSVFFALLPTMQAQHPTLQTPAASTQPAATTTPAAQEPVSTVPTLSVDARLVNLPVVVRDKNGALVQNLTEADFVLQVDGHPQTIRYFDLDSNLPLTLGLLVDTSMSQRNVLDEERSASSAFLDQMLTGPKDQAFVVQFARQIELLQDLTSSRPKLQAALKDLDTSNPSSPSDSNDTDDSNGHHNRAGGTTLYDSVFLASDELMSKQKGRKAVILLTDGDDRGSKETLVKAIEATQRADTIIYAIYFKGEEPRPDNDNGNHRGGGFPRSGGIGFPGSGGGYPGGGGNGGGNRPSQQPTNRTDGKKTLERMAQETGGRMFEVSKKQPVADIYTEIGKELRGQYRLGYTPDQATAADGYHQIDLSLSGSDKKKLTIQTRDGYYTGQ
ncbi:VWA domain-containing protein [Granulicella arctica]|uniref:VWFA-related protein n=1 Tax=Granulicella arctica TaxID=940613 RepID=A0A7Y9TEY8_9BACT|nr:VWA domain-containing protein [Granulicella arctica]NYF77754.1 VWFA-related protein [Granulicella arctica]